MLNKIKSLTLTQKFYSFLAGTALVVWIVGPFTLLFGVLGYPLVKKQIAGYLVIETIKAKALSLKEKFISLIKG